LIFCAGLFIRVAPSFRKRGKRCVSQWRQRALFLDFCIFCTKVLQ